ncbi:helix-turn-helix domain-containing protein [Alteromonas sediminis]|uniref:Helix-turn-helix domain-containing protein n=2 Tax=Alteromonas sediminis TaxID=2259342 RepID=A0A3N5Y436_9ALTE|nr:helix-turn-helix domain-containing protein [Alteromonas sediminis]
MLSSAITGAIDLFSLAGITWHHIHHTQPQQIFDVSLCSVDKAPFKCINGIQLLPHKDIASVVTADLVLVPTIGGDLTLVTENNQALLTHLRRLYDTGCKIASNCTGAFLLAEAGLLDGKVATTHWGYETPFKQRYPQVQLDISRLVTHQDGVYCSGGGVAWLDLVLLLIAEFCGEQVAEETAKAHVLDHARTSQRAYTSIQQKTLHGDMAIAKVQHYILTHYTENVDIAVLADIANMSPRTFSRRFKAACEMTPQQYVQSVRIEHARKQLDITAKPIEQIVHDVGYSDVSSFIQLFKRWVGQSPHQYRMRKTRG